MIRFLTTFVSLIFAFALLAVPQAAEQTLLFPGAQSYTICSHSVGSQAKIQVASPEAALCLRRATRSYTGESAFYENAHQAFFQAKRYGGKLRFTQQVQGSTDYYFYSPRLRGAVLLQGKAVNLHICVRNGAATIGTPLIFGSC